MNSQSSEIDFKPGDALLIVDVQVDFCPGGRLPVNDGAAVVPVLNKWIAAAEDAGVPTYASRDWHPRGHVSFSEQGGQWPPHCIQDTEGAEFHPDLELPADVVTVTKGTRFDKDQYSAFDETGLDDRLEKDGVERLFVGGLAEDVCVRATVLSAIEAGLDVVVIRNATRPVITENGDASLDEMKEAGAEIR